MPFILFILLTIILQTDNSEVNNVDTIIYAYVFGI